MVQKLKDFSIAELRGDLGLFLEKRMENDGSGNPIYIGYTREAGAATSDAVWFIVKVTYDGSGSPTYYALPNAGINFEYIWNSRATYF